ncbi:MAG: hypothetical protein AMXMBFR47_00470 [Planctomycetota bacterium]
MRRIVGIGLVAIAMLWLAWIVPDTPEEARGDRKPGQVLLSAGLLIAGLTLVALPGRARRG